MHQNPMHNRVKRCCSALREEHWRGSVLHNKTKMGHFLGGGGTTINHLNFHRKMLGFFFLTFLFEYFWMPSGGFFIGGGIKREYTTMKGIIIYLFDNQHEHPAYLWWYPRQHYYRQKNQPGKAHLCHCPVIHWCHWSIGGSLLSSLWP